MKTSVKNFIKTVVFLLLVLVIYVGLTKVFGVSNEFSEHAEMMVNGYYELEDDSVDMLVVGNSHVYRFWQPAFSYKECGVAASNFSVSDMPPGTVQTSAIEALKTQHPKVLIFDITPFCTTQDAPNNKLYYLSNNMKLSKNYVQMISNFLYYSKVESTKEKLPYYFSLAQFHSRWTSINEKDFIQTMEPLLNSCYQEDFLTTVLTGETHIYTDERKQISPGSEEALRDLIKWCDKQDKDMKIVFYSAPDLMGKERKMLCNYIKDIIAETDYDFIDFNEQEWFDSFDFVIEGDFQDKNHTNLKGAYKFTVKATEYLMDKYGLEDHRGEDKYSEWDKKAAIYYEKVQPTIDAPYGSEYPDGTPEDDDQ